jgi:RND family efflux transporter MFP subunit
MSHPFRILQGLGLLALSAVTLPGCSGSRGPEDQKPPPPPVTVSRPIERTVTDYEAYSGRTEAIDSVQVRARVNGYLLKINFQDGAEVREGDVLFEIDPRPYQAALDQASAQVTLQEAQLAYQDAVYRRNAKLQGTGQAVSVEELQQSLAQRDTTKASLNAAKANVEQAKLNLDWTKVQAPVSGRLSRTLITRGNLVVADNTVLTTIVSLDPMYAYFDIDEHTMLQVQQMIREGKFQSARRTPRQIAAAFLALSSLQGGRFVFLTDLLSLPRVPVALALANEEGFPHDGHLDFVNNRVDPSTGTLQVRGVFPNPRTPSGDRVLSPGLFVRVRVPIGLPHPALLVSQRAVAEDQGLKLVYVVNDKNVVERREVRVGSEQEGLQVIEEGLKPDDRVIVSGLQRVRPGVEVNPKLVDMPLPPKRPGLKEPAAAPKVPPAPDGQPRR